MKITYPECQIEVSAKELIALMDYKEKNKPIITYKPDILSVFKEARDAMKNFRITDGGIINDDALKDHLKVGEIIYNGRKGKRKRVKRNSKH